jgi:hypothetical protein
MQVRHAVEANRIDHRQLDGVHRHVEAEQEQGQVSARRAAATPEHLRQRRQRDDAGM